MAGVKGRSGRKPLSAAAHLLRGTFRPDRHGPRPVTAGATALQAPACVPAVPSAVVDGLGERGLSFVLEVWSDYGEWTPASMVLLRQAGQVLDALEDYAANIARTGALIKTPRGGVLPHPLLRVQHSARATLLALVSALNLKER
jgi:hypothetical protein